jgi:predicted HicB family RNase H-like nuclease
VIKRRSDNEKAIEEFAAKANEPAGRIVMSQTASAETRLDKKAKPTRGLNLRFNDYQHLLLQRAAEQEDVSMQKVINRVLWPALEELLHEKSS